MTTSLHPPGLALRALLLDIDGTLLDSNDAHARAWVRAFAEHGYVIPFGHVRPLIGKGGDKLIPELTGLDAESGEATRISESRADIFRREELRRLSPTPGARALLARLSALGYQLAVATSAAAEEVTALLEQAGVADLIQAASSSDDAERSKPDPDIIRAALQQSGRTAGECLMLGDTPYDVEASARARVPCIALRCGGWADDALAGAIAIYENPADLLAHLGTSPLAGGARD